MATEQQPLQRDTQDSDASGESSEASGCVTEQCEFKKYAKMLPELRAHATTYLNLETIQNYSQCSNYCNYEIQRLNTVAPHFVDIKEKDDEIDVELRYNKSSIIKKTFKNGDTVEKEIREYLMKCFKYVKTRVFEVVTNMKTWPTSIATIPQISNACIWRVQIHTSMSAKFLTFIKENMNNLLAGCEKMMKKDGDKANCQLFIDLNVKGFPLYLYFLEHKPTYDADTDLWILKPHFRTRTDDSMKFMTTWTV